MPTTDLHYEVFVPDAGPTMSFTLTSTLIVGRNEAVLVDPPIAHEQAGQVGDWIQRVGKRLAFVCATHARGDHWFGTAQLLRRFPGAIPCAAEGTIRLMRRQANAGRARVRGSDRPASNTDTSVAYRSIPAEGFALEGHRIILIEVGRTDTDHTSVLHVPGLGVVVAGDVVGNGVHQWLADMPGGGFESWLAALDTVEALGPRFVVARHKNPDLPDDPTAIDKTRQYVRFAPAVDRRQPHNARGLRRAHRPLPRPAQPRGGLVLRHWCGRLSGPTQPGALPKRRAREGNQRESESDMTRDTTETSAGADGVTMPDVNVYPGAFLAAVGQHYTEVTPTQVRGHLDLSPEHRTPWGVVHGGVYATVVETAATLGASAAIADRGEVAVGVANSTDFLRPMTDGRVEIAAEPIQQGRNLQLWQVSITNVETGKLVARGQLRLANVPAAGLP